jgi:plasmid segregation protein ParM
MANRRNKQEQPVVSAQTPAVDMPVQPAPSALAELICAATVGVDVGFGSTKAVLHTGKSVVFRSVFGPASEFDFQEEKISHKYPGDQITDDEGDWFVGDLAISQIPPDQVIRLQARSNNDFGHGIRVRFFKVALGKLLPNLNGDVIHLTVATGLPVAHMADAAALKSAIIGRHRIKTDQTDFVANVTDCIVMPQPYGTIYRMMYLPDGTLNPADTKKRKAVIDIGEYTIDYAVDDDGEYVAAESGSLEAGVHTVKEVIRKHLTKQYGQPFTDKEVEHILLNKWLRISGDVIRFDTVVDDAINSLQTTTTAKAGQLWKAARRMDVIAVSGGGTPLIADPIKKAYAQSEKVENPQTANAEGYLRYALWAAANPDEE